MVQLTFGDAPPVPEVEHKSTKELVVELKGAGEDYEWYPTTDEMVDVVKSKLPKDAGSILDIGAGDGRVLEAFMEKCQNADLYAIEKSLVLIQQQGKDIIPVGVEFYEQNLSALQVGYIFCNPPYSDFEGWTCKIIEEGYARKAFLVVPSRWNQSKRIKKSLKDRGATATVLFIGDFYSGERPARAKIEIVEIEYPLLGGYRSWNRTVQDPFDVWFDNNIDTFDKSAEFDESESSEDLAKKFRYSSIAEMVEAYQDEYKRFEANYRAIFKLDYAILRELGVDKEKVRGGLKMKMSNLKIRYWGILFERLDAITSRLTTKSSNRLLEKLTRNNSIDFTEKNAYAVVIWAIKNANEYFDEQIVDLFYQLATHDGVENYKSNQKVWKQNGWRYNSRDHSYFTLDYRIVIKGSLAIYNGGWSQYEYPGNLYQEKHNLIADIIAVFGNMGFRTSSLSSYHRDWEKGKWQDFLHDADGDVLFQVKGYLNGNVHIRFKQEAIKSLNIEAARILKWISCKEDVVEEMGYSMEIADKYFGSTEKIEYRNVQLLSAQTSA